MIFPHALGALPDAVDFLISHGVPVPPGFNPLTDVNPLTGTVNPSYPQLQHAALLSDTPQDPNIVSAQTLPSGVIQVVLYPNVVQYMLNPAISIFAGQTFSSEAAALSAFGSYIRNNPLYQDSSTWKALGPAFLTIVAAVATAGIGAEFAAADTGTAAGGADAGLSGAVPAFDAAPATVGGDATLGSSTATLDTIPSASPLTNVAPPYTEVPLTSAPIVEPVAPDITLASQPGLSATPIQSSLDQGAISPLTTSNADLAPEQLAGPTDTGAVTTPTANTQSVQLPQVVSEAAKPGVIAQIAQTTGTLSSAEAAFARLYTAVKGGSAANPPTYQRTGSSANAAAAGGGTLADSGLGANVTPVLKQLLVPGIALLAALFS